MNPLRVVEAQKLLERWMAMPQLSQAYPLYTKYLTSLANAERLNAGHAYLRPLIIELDAASHAARWTLIHSLCKFIDFSGRAPGSSPGAALPHDLLERVAIPTLLAHREKHPDDSAAHLWLALLPSRKVIPGLPDPRQLLDHALRLSPNDPFIAERVADERLHSVWFSCHHLPSSLLGPVAAIRRDIAELRGLLPLIVPERRASLEKQVSHYEKEVEDFVAGHSEPSTDS